jgi:hypothetical protein
LLEQVAISFSRWADKLLLAALACGNGSKNKTALAEMRFG